MTQPLFNVVVLHHVADPTAAARVKALRQAFEIPAPETDAPWFATEPDPWTYVSCAAYSDPAEFERRASEISKRALFVILVTEKMVDDPAWGESLNILALTLPRKADQDTRNALCFATFEAAQDKLPGRLRERQAPESSVLGERRLRPHTLALLALHRARLLLGAEPNRNKLTLFISHAKAHGLFLAHSLRSLIQEVPELKTGTTRTTSNPARTGRKPSKRRRRTASWWRSAPTVTSKAPGVGESLKRRWRMASLSWSRPVRGVGGGIPHRAGRRSQHGAGLERARFPPGHPARSTRSTSRVERGRVRSAPHLHRRTAGVELGDHGNCQAAHGDRPQRSSGQRHYVRFVDL